MDPVVILLGSAAVLVLAALFFLSRRPKKEDNDVEPAAAAGVENDVAAAGTRRRPRRPAEQRLRDAVAARHAVNRRQGHGQEVEGFDPDSPDDVRAMIEEEMDRQGPNVGTKKLRKIQQKAEAAAAREAEEQRRKEKKEREEERDAERRKKEEEEEAEEKRLAKEEEKRKEEQERREQEEYELLKSQFCVEDAGEDAIDEEESQSLLQEFIDFIKTQKVVLLEDLAARFNLKTQDAIARLQDLLAGGQIEGLMDDRGKFIHITQEEYKAVSKFIAQNGRVSIADLSHASTKLLNL